MSENAKSPEPEKCGFCAIIGAPNAGKSTLLNRLIGERISIVTPKVQTTRAHLRGIAITDATQIIYVDTPGIFHPKRKLDEAMVEAAWTGTESADCAVLMIDSQQGINREVDAILENLPAKKTIFLALNKIDQLARSKLLELAAVLNGRHAFSGIFMISALTGDGVEDLADAVAGVMPQGTWLYPEDQIADLPVRLLAAELTREQLYLRLHQELPYASTVETESWQEQRDGSIRIQQVIYVARESQKKIVLGKGGQTIKKIGQLAREAITQALDQRVHLFLFVKVREKWDQDNERLRMMGLDV